MSLGPSDSPTSAAVESPRAAAIAALYREAASLVALGDLAAARAVHATIASLLSESEREGGAKVIDLNEERRGRR